MAFGSGGARALGRGRLRAPSGGGVEILAPGRTAEGGSRRATKVGGRLRAEPAGDFEGQGAAVRRGGPSRRPPSRSSGGGELHRRPVMNGYAG